MGEQTYCLVVTYLFQQENSFMRNKLFLPKTSQGTRSSWARDTKDSFTHPHLLTVYSQQRETTSSFKEAREEDELIKESNFDQLKKEIKCLENSQFLSLKYKVHTEPPQKEEMPNFRTTNKDFMPNCKLTQIEKFKHYLKRKGKSRRISLLLENHKTEPSFEPPEYNCLNFLKVRDLNAESKGEVNFKKRETPNIVKKYYRPQTSNYRSVQQLKLRSNQVRGRKLVSSVSNRQEKEKEKENVLIYCY